MKPNRPAHPRGKSGLLVEAATLLFGPNYMQPLAALVKRDRRTLHRWLRDESPIPMFVWCAIHGALGQHAIDLNYIRVKVAARCDKTQSEN